MNLHPQRLENYLWMPIRTLSLQNLNYLELLENLLNSKFDLILVSIKIRLQNDENAKAYGGAGHDFISKKINI